MAQDPRMLTTARKARFAALAQNDLRRRAFRG